MDVKSKIEEILDQTFQPRHLEIQDDSDLHASHPEAIKSGGGHFSVVVVSEAFKDKTLRQRHQMVYDVLLKDDLKEHIHALKLKTSTPDEVA